jgi:Ras GTPase-activating-like protein IQGAP2/3
LIVNNKMTFEELAKAKRRAGAAGQESQFHHNVNNDPFTTGAHLDRQSQRKLELYEHLFFTLQTRPEYLSRLLRAMSKDESADKDRTLVESVALILFGYERREEYLFHKLLQVSLPI